jgi:predicted dehydrogenase
MSEGSDNLRQKVLPTMDILDRVLVVGVGSIGQRHVRCFQNTGRAEVSICEIDSALRSRVARDYRIDRCYADLDAALADRHDAAVIATPAHLHVPMAIRVAEAGLHLLVEKPLSTSMEGVGRLQQIVQSQDLMAAVAYCFRAHPILQAMREAIASGRFGRPVEVIATDGQHFPTYRPAYRGTYYRDHATGGGAIQDAITHILNAGEWLVGPIDRLSADAAHQVLEGVVVEDTVHVLTRHGHVLGCYSLNQYQAPNELTITVVCEQGTVRFEDHLRRWRWMTRPEEPWHDEPAQALARDALFINQANRFIDVLKGLAPPFCSLEDGIQSLRVSVAALASVERGAWQTIRSLPAQPNRTDDSHAGLLLPPHEMRLVMK